ncbi:DUF6000 family protein [Puniceicoccus vermicola]|uniref:Uncharacterized protein n=1 Tax=Puniceicoccus vermicola TaxID=388746 RepID=A0A7X1E362_9BACT|nr:DUF6000 family protein [Puniceicoccus vermicola]MBC2600633.1 hypothetical protein [Puniceicoccus vermicola]
MSDIIEEYIKPLYMKVLHGNFVKEENEAFIETSNRACSELSDKDIQELLGRGWREAIVASWIVALRKESSFIKKMRENLIPSRCCFSGEFHLIALARINSEESQQVIIDYLEKYLPVGSNCYDQKWAYGALHLINPSLARKYDDDILWKQIEGGKEFGIMDRMKGIDKVRSVFDFIESNFNDLKQNQSLLDNA